MGLGGGVDCEGWIVGFGVVEWVGWVDQHDRSDFDRISLGLWMNR